MLLATGEVVATVSGRHTSPFPRVDVATERKTKATLQRVTDWLLSEAVAEAESRGDSFARRQFESALQSGPITQADKDGAHLYLFGVLS